MPPSLPIIRAKSPILARRIENQGYMLTQDDVKSLQALFPHMMLLVRCGKGRFMVKAQDCEHFTNIIREHAEMKNNDFMTTDHVRDVSLPAD